MPDLARQVKALLRLLEDSHAVSSQDHVRRIPNTAPSDERIDHAQGQAEPADTPR